MATQVGTVDTTARHGARVTPLRRPQTWVAYGLMVLFGVVFMFPFFWTLSSSLKTAAEVYIFPPVWLPAVPQWSNYATVFERLPYARWFLNSVVVFVLSSAGVLVSATLVAYSFARFRYHGRDLLFLVTLATMMLPAEVTLIPQYLLFKELGWLNTIQPLWVPAWFGGYAFNIFLLRQFILSVPRELDEAAIVDGASYPRVLVSILVPLMKPALATVAVINFIGGWNDFLGPLIYLNSPETFTLALGLRYFNVTPGQPGLPENHLLMAAVVMATAPCILLFFLAQRVFVQGIVLSGIKG
jgi:ABC-type glycerol-3-phosphate transport system permease component